MHRRTRGGGLGSILARDAPAPRCARGSKDDIAAFAVVVGAPLLPYKTQD
jgi:hypothetical protein